LIPPVFALAILFVVPALALADGEPVAFDRDIRPILSDNCFQCHGPDVKKRQGELRLDVEDDVYVERDGKHIVVPGKPAESELFRRITTDDADLHMPPAASQKTLTAAQVELIRRWIEQGAKWQKHWAFVAPVRPSLPAVQNPGWIRNSIDAFILARLERENLAPSAEADKTTLLRRVTLDLTGLPPTIPELDAFLTDESPNAYERVVDRLLQSQRYGERMAVPWLDAARYADTNGYQTDGERFMWRWRDWVIESFNNNLPYDQFTLEQLAGDLLPNPTLDQMIATGFNRNHRGNGEGGIIPEEYAVEYVVDRVETASTVWLGLTLGCCRCHEHKYDPFAQQEFYRLFAFFNNIPENGRANKHGNSPPMIKAPTREQQEKLGAMDREVADAESRFAKLAPELTAAQAAWEKAPDVVGPVDWTVTDGLVHRFNLDGDALDAAGKAKPPEAIDGAATFVPGKLGQALACDGKRFFAAADAGKLGYYDRFTLAAWVQPQGDKGVILSRMMDEATRDGYYLQLDKGHLQVNLVKRWLDDSIRVETVSTLEPGRWQHVLVTYDGSRVAAGVQVYIDGKPVEVKVHLDALNQDFTSEEPLRIGGGGGPENRYQGLIDDVRLYQRVLTPAEASIVATAERIDEILPTDVANRSAAQSSKLAAYYLAERAPSGIRSAASELAALSRKRAEMLDIVPTVMVMQEMNPPRQTHLLIRGQYDNPGEAVTAGVPACLPPLPEGVPQNRLGLARWLVDPAHPLTARVAVNRFWQMCFGTGLVKTNEDFGSQGERPSHPELLDWLATEFIRTGWDVKAMQKLIVMSATYRQQSKVTPELVARDPENRLLARGARLRLSADMIRDQALFVSGLLVEKLGGPSVKPYQPAGLWEEIADQKYVPDTGEGLYRRSLYTFWKRTAAPPTMMNFDASPREMCTVKASRTNTPLQALTLMNDVTFVEAARVLAERVMIEGGQSPERRIALAFRLATSRTPAAAELKVLVNGYNAHLDRYRLNPAAADKLVSVGERPRNKDLDSVELASFTAITALILNLDEVVTKE
jgi:hypothetical protein